MKRLLTFVSLFAVVLTGCAEFEEPAKILAEEIEKEASASVSQTRASASVAYQVNSDNPYALHNVQSALNLVVGSGAPTLQATHKYIRFLPQSESDIEYLNDLDFDMFPYPFDYDLSLTEMETHENTLLNGYAWQYCLVPPNFTIPAGMAGEILDYAYMQSDEPGQTRAPGEQLDHDVYGAAIDKAMELAGYTTPQTRANEWQPSATIKYNSGVAGEATMPLKNVLVRVNTTFNSGEGYTDANGNVTITKGRGGRFKKATLYQIIWKTDKWKIHDGFGKSKHKGPEQKSHWSFTISGNGSNHTAMCATIHKALNVYYNETYPKVAGLAKYGSINVKEHHNESNGTIHGNFWHNRYNEINIWGRGSNAYSTAQILATTFHELGHASDYAYSGTILNEQNEVQETWADGVEVAYMSSLYPNNYIQIYNSFPFPFDRYDAIIESLMYQGLSLSQLQTMFTTKTNLTDCVAPLTNLGIPGVLVNSIFSNIISPYRVNLTKPITGPDSPELNTNVTYSVPEIIRIIENNVGNAPYGTSFNG